MSARSEWYERLGHRVVEATETGIVTQGGFTSEHFREDRLRALVGSCELVPLGDIAFVVRC